jgi:phosphatidate cytidylyltransferase
VNEKNKNLVTRSLTGIVFVTVLISSILIGYTGFALLFLLITLLAASELSGMIGWKRGSKTHNYIVFSAGVIFLLNALVANNAIPVKYLSLIVVFILLPFIFQLGSHSPEPFTQVSKKVMIIIYTCAATSLLCHIVLSGHIYMPHILLGMLYMLWAHDSGAYITGFLIGKTKLFERVSPKKTWEGAIGGLVFAVATGFIISRFFLELQMITWIVLAIIITVLGSLGDLVESHLKRSLGIKDSGNILPGHGGMLDRFDSLFYAIPFIWVFLTLIR